MARDEDDDFEGIETAKVSDGGNWMAKGIHKVEIKKCKKETNWEGKKFFIVEVICRGSDNKDMVLGGEYSWVVKMDGKMWLGNILGFVKAVMPQLPPEKITKTFIGNVVSEENPFEGEVVEVFVNIITTKKNTPFSKHKWRPVKTAEAAA